MSTQHIETLIIGAGQAGLSTAYHLARMGRPHLIVDAGARIGDNWRAHYDSLRLFTPAKANGLAGLDFPGDDPWHFPSKDEMAAYLETYALTHDLAVRTSTRVDRIAARDPRLGGFRAEIGEDLVTCDNVVVATGTFGRTPRLPEFAGDLDPSIHQVHSVDYHRPEDLPDGSVLVVGASHSGCDIAFELAATHDTILCGSENGQFPFPWGSLRMRMAFPFVRFAFQHVLTRRTPIGRKMMTHVRHHGGPMLRVRRGDLRRRGVVRVTERVAGVAPNGRPVLEDGRVVEVATVVWCTGFRQSFDWIDLPGMREEGGWPREYRGVVDELPGLYFCGLSFQYSFSSMEVAGVARDSAHVARSIAERMRAGAERAVPAHVGSAERSGPPPVSGVG